jgi:plasmid stabilization system protein ParE
LKVVITQFAATQLKEISSFHSKRENNNYVRKLQSQFLDSLIRLEINPELGQKQLILVKSNFEYRYLLVNKTYKVIYRQTDELIYIVDFFDTRQDPMKIGRNV